MSKSFPTVISLSEAEVDISQYRLIEQKVLSYLDYKYDLKYIYSLSKKKQKK